MQTQSSRSESQLAYADVAGFAALGSATLLLLAGTRRGPLLRFGLSLAAVMLAYRGLAGRWPVIDPNQERDDTKRRLSGSGGIHVRESIRLDRSLDAAYAFWRRLENLPRFMTHLEKVTELDDRRSHWVAKGPAGVAVEWDAEIIQDIPGKVIGWRSLPGSDIVTAGSVNFDEVPGGTELTVHLQYDPPAGRAGAFVASLFDAEASQTIRADLQELQRLFDSEPDLAGVRRDSAHQPF